MIKIRYRSTIATIYDLEDGWRVYDLHRDFNSFRSKMIDKLGLAWSEESIKSEYDNWFDIVEKCRVSSGKHHDSYWEYELMEAPDFCLHDWKNYVGFTKVYNYCTKCDAKENV